MSIEEARKAFEAGDADTCEQACKQELERSPKSIAALEMLQFLYLRTRRYPQAREILERLLAFTTDPKKQHHHHQLRGFICLNLRDLAAAEQSFQAVLAIDPNNVSALGNLTTLNLLAGQRDQVVHFAAALVAALATAPLQQLLAFPDAVANAIYTAIDHLDEEATTKLETFLEQSCLNPELAALSSEPSFDFARAKLMDRASNFQQAMETYKLANAKRRHRSKYDIKQDRVHYQLVLQQLDSELLDSLADQKTGSEGPQPIFVVGMPRSGTSLVEQILGSHTQVTPLGEIPTMYGAINQAMQEHWQACGQKTPIAQVEQAVFDRMGELYLQHVTPKVEGAFFTDKYLSNLLNAWVIARALPSARFVCLTREKFATVMSCFTSNFSQGLGFTEYLPDCADIYDLHTQLADKWSQVLPTRFLAVNYEQLVAQPQSQIAGILDFVGLEHEATCFSPHKLDRVVNTASMLQVIQPIYQHGNERWETYRDLAGQARGPAAIH
jgi:tetratricopeptide (TPR) repeat protein